MVRRRRREKKEVYKPREREGAARVLTEEG